jgi:L-alanine-DL-glutamate epimerase-like enolase superfamily enzyme
VRLGAAAALGYVEGEERPTGFVTLEGGGHAGWGECVAWSAAEQEQFAEACPALVPAGGTTVGAFHASLGGAHRYHAAAIEAAAIDLALRQAGSNPFLLAGRPAKPVAYCRSLGSFSIERAGGPVEAVAAALQAEPPARIKIDAGAEPWPGGTWRALAGTRRVVVVDFKRRGRAADVALVHACLPEAWLEDPPAEALDPAARWRPRVALDGYVQKAADLAPPPVEPGAVNVKMARMGGLLEALGALEICARRGWPAYVGGMFEVGPGRLQARVLASLFTAEAWNDVAPLDPAATPAPERLTMGDDFRGFAPLTPAP